tara:strand:+ start:3427 stop:4434 length:1008 start_codon:yes stop_codon:yes gene_type:complete
MSFKQFDTEDIVVSADSISSIVWSTGNYQLTTFFTSSTQDSSTSGDYYLDVYQTGSTLTNAAVQFSIAYGNKDGLGSTAFNTNVAGKSPSATVYGQYRSLVLGDEETDFVFGGVTSAKGIFAISLDRARYKEKLLPGTFELTIKSGSVERTLTDNSGMSTVVTFTDAGRVYEVISGSNGVSHDGGTGYSANNGSYGKFLPDIGVIILNAAAVNAEIGNNTLFVTSSTATNGNNNAFLYEIIELGQNFKINAEETVSSNYVFVRVRNSEFNYSNNPSNISGSGEIRHSSMVNNPQAYITTVGLYNDTNDLLGVAKLSKPLLKDFTKEALIRIKLDY